MQDRRTGDRDVTHGVHLFTVASYSRHSTQLIGAAETLGLVHPLQLHRRQPGDEDVSARSGGVDKGGRQRAVRRQVSPIDNIYLVH